MNEYLKKRLAELRAQLESYKEELRDKTLTDAELKKIQDACDKCVEECNQITELLGDGSGDDAGSDDGSDDGSDGSGDDTGSDDGTGTGDDGSDDGKETKSGADGEDDEARANIRKIISRGLTIPKKENDERREKRTREVFSRMAVGAAVDPSEVRELGIVTGNGKVTIPKSIENEIISAAVEENPLRQFGTTVKTTDDHGYPVLVKKATANGHSKERTTANPIPDSSIELDEIVLNPTEFDALAVFSNKLQYRSGINVEQAVVSELTKAYVEKEADYMANGLEAGNLNPGSLLTKATDWNPTAAVDVTDGAAMWDALIHFKNSFKKEIRKNAMFMLNTAAVDAIETLKDGNGRPLYRALDAAENGQLGVTDGKLLGFNAHVSDYLYADNTLDDSIPAIYFGDFKSFHIQDVVGAMQLQTLNELYAASNQVGVKVYNLLDGQLIYSPLEPTITRFNLSPKA